MPGAGGIWTTLFWIWLVAEIVLGIGTFTASHRGAASDRGSQSIIWIAVVGGVTACDWIRETAGPTMFDGARWPRTVGVLLLAAGLALRTTAIVTLGRSFSSNVAIRPGQRVRRTGLYGLVRHPSYSGLVAIFLAIGLHSRNWMAMAAMLAPSMAALLYRIHVEERVLLAAFGDEYRDYAATTKRLIPWVY